MRTCHRVPYRRAILIDDTSTAQHALYVNSMPVNLQLLDRLQIVVFLATHETRLQLSLRSPLDRHWFDSVGSCFICGHYLHHIGLTIIIYN